MWYIHSSNLYECPSHEKVTLCGTQQNYKTAHDIISYHYNSYPERPFFLLSPSCNKNYAGHCHLSNDEIIIETKEHKAKKNTAIWYWFNILPFFSNVFKLNVAFSKQNKVMSRVDSKCQNRKWRQQISLMTSLLP